MEIVYEDQKVNFSCVIQFEAMSPNYSIFINAFQSLSLS